MPADLIDQLTSDPDFLTLSESEQDQMYEELAGHQAQPQSTPFVPGQKRVEESIAKRGSGIGFLRAAGQDPSLIQQHPFLTGLSALGLPFEAGESAGANTALALQRGQPQDIGRDVMAGLRGERPAQFGDVFRSVNVPDPVSSMLGLALMPGGANLQEAIGKGGVGLAQRGIAGLRSIPITTASKARALQSIREGFLSAPKIAGTEFESGLNRLVAENPNQKVDLSSVVKQLQDAEQATPGVKSTISRAIRTNKHAAFVESLMSGDSSSASNLTLQEAQAFKRTLQDAMRNKWNQFAPELNDVHLELTDAWHGTRQAQLAAFPEMQDVLGAYGQQMNRFRVLKPMFKQGQLSGAVMGKLENEPEIRTMAEQLLPDETLKQIRRYRTTQRVATAAKIGATAGVASMTPPGKAVLKLLGVAHD